MRAWPLSLRHWAWLALTIATAHCTLINGDLGRYDRGGAPQRCSAAGTVMCRSFDSPAELDTEYTPPSPGDTRAELDPVVKVEGTSSLRLTAPSMAGPNGAGFYGIRFARAATDGGRPVEVTFSEGQQFYLQWRERISASLLEQTLPQANGWTSVLLGPVTAQPYAQTPFLGVLDDGFRGLPVLSLDNTPLTPDAPGVAGDVFLQNATGCRFSDQRSSACVHYKSETWATFQLAVTMGHSGTADGRIKLSMASEAGPAETLIDVSDLQIDTARGFGMVWLMLYAYPRDPAQAGPEAQLWFDDLVLSTEPIPFP